jgi:two-component system alkaline phosphatase synthesis response regulator PhoP
VTFGEVTIDFTRHHATKRGIRLTLTPREFEMLRFFARNRGAVVTREALLNSVWGYDSMPNTRTVDAHIVKLRQKIEADPAKPAHIQTVHGAGYKFIG